MLPRRNNRQTRDGRQAGARPTNNQQTTRLAMVGTRASGKSTCIGLLNMTAIDMEFDAEEQQDQIGTYFARAAIGEGESQVRSVMNDLYNLRFPPPTPTSANFRSHLELIFERRGRLGGRLRAPSQQSVELTLTDVAGETMTELLEAVDSGETEFASFHDFDEINKYILSASSFIMIVDVASLIRGSLPQYQEEHEVSQEQDASMARFVDKLRAWKQQNRTSPRIEKVALIGTKYDEARPLLGVNFGQFGDLEGESVRFLMNYLPQTWQALRSIFPENTRDHLEVFYSEVTIDQKSTEDYGEVRIHRSESGRRPQYSVEEYQRLINWFGELTE